LVFVFTVWSVLTVFAVAFASNVSPFFGASYSLYATLQFTELGVSLENFVLVVLASAVGATLAKVVLYYGAFGLKRYLVGNKNVQLIGRNSNKRWFYLVLFVAAIAPIFPLDDFIFIGAGAASASIGLMTAVTLLAKLLKSAFEITLILAILTEVGTLFGFEALTTTIALSISFLVIGVVFYKVDWERLYKRMAGGSGSRVATNKRF
jgi:hypothetical protein